MTQMNFARLMISLASLSMTFMIACGSDDTDYSQNNAGNTPEDNTPEDNILEVCDDDTDNDADGDVDCDDSDCVDDTTCQQTDTDLCTTACVKLAACPELAVTCTSEDITAFFNDCLDDRCVSDARDQTINLSQQLCTDITANLLPDLQAQGLCQPSTDNEICDDDTDNDEDGDTDCDDADCAQAENCAPPTPVEICDDEIDNDDDGDTDCDDEDCAQANGCFEVCDDEIDNNDDGDIDCDDTDCTLDIACIDTAACDDAEALDGPGTYTGQIGDANNYAAGDDQEGDCTNGEGAGFEDVRTFTVDTDGAYCIDTNGTSFSDAVLYVREDCNNPNSQTVCDDDSANGSQAELTLHATAGTTYFLFIDAYNNTTDAMSEYTLNIRSGPCTEQICDDNIDEDGDELFDCTDPDCADADICQEVCDDNIDNDEDDNTDCDDSDCALAINCINTFACDEAQNQQDPIDGPGTYNGVTGIGNNYQPTPNGMDCNDPDAQGSEDVQTFAVDTDGTYCIDTNGSIFDSVLYIREDCNTPESQIICDDDSGVNSRSEVQLDAIAGTTYFLFIDTWSEDEIIPQFYTLNIRSGPCTEQICDNGIDEDGDELIDCEDEDCNNSEACTEQTCDDNLDEDGDDLIDCADPDCADANICQEVCDDDIDNDLDGATDCDDSNCNDADACNELICNDNLDEDEDGDIDCDDFDCRNAPNCNPETACNDNQDNDEDGDTDCDDTDCEFSLDCVTPSSCQMPLTTTTSGITRGNLRGREDNFTDSCGGQNSPDEVFLLQIPADGTYCLDTSESSFNTTLSIFSTCEDATSEVLCDEDGGSPFNRAQAQWDALAGDYYVVVAAFSDNTNLTNGDFQLNIYEGPCGESLCADGLDNDNDEDIDCDDSDCTFNEACVETACDDNIDNDGNGQTDCLDVECAGTPLCATDTLDIAPLGQSVTTSGSIDDTDLLWMRLGESCSPSNQTHHFDAITITNNTGVDQLLNITAAWQGDGFLHLFEAPYNIANPDHCITADDDFTLGDNDRELGSRITNQPIAAGQTLILVASTFTPNQAIGAYNITVDTLAIETACGDEEDNDGDGDIDCADTDCADTDICIAAALATLCQQAQAITTPGAYTGTLGDTSVTAGYCRTSGTDGGSEDILAFTPTTDGPFCIDTQGTTFDTLLYARNTCEDISEEAELACNDDITSDNTASQITLEATMGTTYYFVVESYQTSNNAGADYTLNITTGACTQAP